jgi:DNA-binding NarL/FixJ family response regulator
MVRSILIVDDSPTVRQALCEIFNREKDFDVCGEAANGQDAIERAQQLHPDVIVTDLSMPIMSGLEEARVLKQLMPTVPVIIHTAHNDRFIEKEARSAGAYAVISKSDPIATLIAAARSIFYQIAAA